MIEQNPEDPTGVSTPDGDDGGHLYRARERKAHSAIQMRAEGHDWDDIALIIGYPDGHRAQVATELALEKELKQPETQHFMRSLATRRLDSLLRSVWDKATDPSDPEHLFAVDRAAKLIAQHTKLHGYEAPAEMVIHSPSTTEIERWVLGIVTQAQPALEEADIFDADVIAGEVESRAVENE